MKDGHIVNATANPGTGIMVSYLKFNTPYGTHFGRVHIDRITIKGETDHMSERTMIRTP